MRRRPGGAGRQSGRRRAAILAGGLVLVGGAIVATAVMGSRDGAPPDVVIEILDRGGHWRVTGAPFTLTAQGDTRVEVPVGRVLRVVNRGATTHFVGPFTLAAGQRIRGRLGRPGVLLGRCRREAPSTLQIVVRGQAGPGQ